MLARCLRPSFTGPEWTRGVLTADMPGGSHATVLADGAFNSQPGIVRLDASRLLCVYNRSTASLSQCYGIILTATSRSPWTFTPGSPFAIYTAQPTNAANGVSIVDGQVVITGPTYSFSTNLSTSPFLIVCNDPPASLTSGSTWGAPVSIPLADYADSNLTIGRVLRLQNGTYLVGFYGMNSPTTNAESGVLISASLTDWSARTKVVVGALGAHNYCESDIIELPGGALAMLLRAETSSPMHTYLARSTDHGSTWSAPADAFVGFGYPAWHRMDSGIWVSAYRQSTVDGLGMPWWRQSVDDGASWSAEALLDGTEVGGSPGSSYCAYACFVRLDASHALCVYSIGDRSGAAHPANLYSQVITDSSSSR